MDKQFNIQVPGGHGSHENGSEITIKVIVDLEDMCLHGKPHPEHVEGEVVYYRFKVDKQHFERKEHHLTGSQLLALVGHTPQTHKLFEIGHSQRVVGPDEVVDFRKPGIERFKSVAKEARDGNVVALMPSPSVMTRRQFDLPLEDSLFLDKKGLPWEALLISGGAWLIIHDFLVPVGYGVESVSLALMLPASYPIAEIDMMYFYPALAKANGRPINALSPQPLDGKTFQRWSRHRPAGMWRPGVDNVETHVLAVSEWLKDELAR